MSKTAIKIGPADHGRKMSLEEFDHAEVQEGYLYELSRGVITVSDVPGPFHFAQADAILLQLTAYRLAHPGRIVRIGTGSECKLLLPALQSERHPDVAVYRTPRPAVPNFWSVWVPEIVVEVVSPSSEERDYGEKREEYLAFGVREYWIFDYERREMVVLRQSAGEWNERTIRPPKVYRTRLLPGLEFSCAAVFEEADREEG